MIFVTLGTHEQPFDRAVDVVGELETTGEEMLIQHGSTPARQDMHNAEWVKYLEWDALTASMRHAEVVVTHAGVGSAVTAIRAGKKPIMVPRLARFGEHVDDHQLELAQRLAERELALVCGPGEHLGGIVGAARHSRPSVAPARRGTLRAAVAAAATDA